MRMELRAHFPGNCTLSLSAENTLDERLNG